MNLDIGLLSICHIQERNKFSYLYNFNNLCQFSSIKHNIIQHSHYINHTIPNGNDFKTISQILAFPSHCKGNCNLYHENLMRMKSQIGFTKLLKAVVCDECIYTGRLNGIINVV